MSLFLTHIIIERKCSETDNEIRSHICTLSSVLLQCDFSSTRLAYCKAFTQDTCQLCGLQYIYTPTCKLVGAFFFLFLSGGFVCFLFCSSPTTSSLGRVGVHLIIQYIYSFTHSLHLRYHFCELDVKPDQQQQQQHHSIFR